MSPDERRCASGGSSFLGSEENVAASLDDGVCGGGGDIEEAVGGPCVGEGAAAAAGSVEGGPGSERAASDAVGAAGSDAGAGASSEGSCGLAGRSLVSTVCHRGRLLKSLFHLPAPVFEAAAAAPGDGEAGCTSLVGLHARLWRAVEAVLASHGMQAGSIVRAMAWFDVVKVGCN